MRNTSSTATKTPETSDLFRSVGTVKIPATIGKFVAKKIGKFMMNAEHDAPVKISYIDNNFIKWFLLGKSGKGKTEYSISISKQTLRYASVCENSGANNRLIVDELGGEAKAETTPFEMFCLLKEKEKTDNNRVNVFYIRDKTGVLRTFDTYLLYDGWSIFVSPVESTYTYKWYDGCYGYDVFFRDSVLKPRKPPLRPQV